ncbi:CD209 antigen-like protein D [Sinocyclocheilus grahami]|uniref:CD209 antigen-like protein D n=1 Tax=Sinocyclocheilus grahami TaxID=75366 RepID=UPI0007AC61C9|nr:PREDICTED: CD209 antigen-like protein D [Sinocyclocheilus grahami]
MDRERLGMMQGICDRSESVKSRSSRADAACLVLLCVLLLTAVIFSADGSGILENSMDIEERTVHGSEGQRGKWYKSCDFGDTLSKDGWVCYQSSLYYVSSEKKNWTESKRDCTERGADLIILNNKQEQDFLKTFPGRSEVWIGVTDSVEEGRWKWVDGSTLSPGFWTSGEPSDSSGNEDCVVNLSSGVADYSCDKTFKWICKKNILKQ